MTPPVSVIVPVYNDEKYLAECIDSILSQSYRQIEVILVDDGSSDSSGKICDKYADTDKRVRVIHKPNGGVSAARNAGVSAASGDFIMMVDADDVLHPLIIDTLLEAIVSNPVCTASVCRFTTKSKADMSVSGNVSVITPREAVTRVLYQDGLDSSLCAKLLPTEAVKKCPEPEGCRYEDLDTIYRIYECVGGNIACVSSAMYYYRINGDNFINNFTSDRLDVLIVTDRIERHYADDPALLRAANDRKFSANYNMYLLAEQAGNREVALRCWQVIKAYRKRVLTDPRVRLKNKVGAILSFLGRKAVMLAARCV